MKLFGIFPDLSASFVLETLGKASIFKDWISASGIRVIGGIWCWLGAIHGEGKYVFMRKVGHTA